MTASKHVTKGAAFAAPVLALMALLWGSVAAGAAMDVNPVRIDLNRVGESAELRISNHDNKPVSVDLATRLWMQDADGKDLLGETDEILAVPPIFTIPPGGQQMVRVAFLGEMDPGLERTFRLLITELNPPVEQNVPAVTMRLQISLPVFVAPSVQSASPDIQLVSARQSDQGTHVSLRNAGNAHVKLKSVEITGSTGTLPEKDKTPIGQARYLLPGATMDFLVSGDPGVLQHVNITSDQGRGWVHAVANPE